MDGKKSLLPVSLLLERGSDQLHLELCAGAAGLGRKISEATVNRPGLALAGFFEHFPCRRVQVVGLAEHAYISSLSREDRTERLKAFMARRIPCIIVTRHLKLFPELTAMAEEAGIPLLRTRMVTKHFVNAATIFMENMMAPRQMVQGTMVEIMGIGVLLEGRAGLGKSETALGLVRKGYALVSDDVTALRVGTSGAVIGAPVDVTRYHMEIRGLGIIHVPSLFGVSAVREEKRLDLVATLKAMDREIEDDRSGGTKRVRNLLGVDIPQVVIPVAPGRDLANVVETAALDFKLKRLGHDAAKELDEKLVALMTGGRDTGE